MKLELIKMPSGWSATTDPGEPGTGKPRWSISSVEAEFISNMFRGLTVLEIGTGLGISTNAIAKKAKHVYTVDIDSWVRDNIVSKLSDNVTFFSSIKKVPIVDAAFIDGLHSYDQCLKDIKECKRLVKKGGIIILHDAAMPSVLKAANESGIGFYEVVTPCGLAVGWLD